MPAGLELVVPHPRRSTALDALRGLAVVLMVADHLALFTGASTFRETAGRAAMPLFFLIGGHLARRVSWRLVQVVVVGVLLEALAPWTGAGSLLLTFAAGVVLVSLVRRWPVVLLALATGGLALGANGYAEVVGTAYDPRCLLGLMALGALVPRELFAGAEKLPRWLAVIGRRPLTFYAGHVVLLVLFGHLL